MPIAGKSLNYLLKMGRLRELWQLKSSYIASILALWHWMQYVPSGKTWFSSKLKIDCPVPATFVGDYCTPEITILTLQSRHTFSHSGLQSSIQAAGSWWLKVKSIQFDVMRKLYVVVDSIAYCTMSLTRKIEWRLSDGYSRCAIYVLADFAWSERFLTSRLPKKEIWLKTVGLSACWPDSKIFW